MCSSDLVEKIPSLMVKKDGMILEQSSLWLKRDGVIRKNTAPSRAVSLFFPEGKCLRNEVFYLIPWCLRQKVVSLQQSLNIGGYTMIEIKETLVIKSDSPKVAEWVKRMKAYKAAQLQDMAKRGCEVCEIAM